ncbi:hypothetical protein IP65_20660 [Novosphingobium sp. AAP1]|nr:hypothetical protein IP65_20660 [Novosphingobium sp. AAP1]
MLTVAAGFSQLHLYIPMITVIYTTLAKLLLALIFQFHRQQVWFSAIFMIQLGLTLHIALRLLVLTVRRKRYITRRSQSGLRLEL